MRFVKERRQALVQVSLDGSFTKLLVNADQYKMHPAIYYLKNLF